MAEDADIMGHCNLCDEQFPFAKAVDHFEVIHPGWVVRDPFEVWPDGGYVVEDDPEPADFDDSETGPDQGKLMWMGTTIRRHRGPKPPTATGWIEGAEDDLPRRPDGTLKPASAWPVLVAVIAAIVGFAWALWPG